MRKFAKYDIPDWEVFYQDSLVFCFVNLKPIVPGHILICPNRVVERYSDLSEAELLQMWRMAKRVGAMMKNCYNPQGITYAVQDGPNAGQTVSHVHIHVIPRYHPLGEKMQIIDDESRKDRTQEERATEANIYRKLLINNT